MWYYKICITPFGVIRDINSVGICDIRDCVRYIFDAICPSGVYCREHIIRSNSLPLDGEGGPLAVDEVRQDCKKYLSFVN